MSLYVKGLQNCSQGVPHSIWAHSFAGLWLPETYSTSLEKSNRKVQGCAGGGFGSFMAP